MQGCAARRRWDELEALFRAHLLVQPLEQTRVFAEGRLDEGRRATAWMLERFTEDRPLRILDIGAGNGGVSLGAANYDSVEVVSLDIIPNPELLALRRASSLPMHACVAIGQRLPFADETFDAVFFLDTLEHVRDPALVAAEIMRVLRRGGRCMITTPARVRYWFARDPHYGIPGLLLLPDALQRVVAEKVLRRTETYDVVHTFWRAGDILRLFAGARETEVLFNRPFPFRNRWLNAAWSAARNLLWDRLVVVK